MEFFDEKKKKENCLFWPRSYWYPRWSHAEPDNFSSSSEKREKTFSMSRTSVRFQPQPRVSHSVCLLGMTCESLYLVVVWEELTVVIFYDVVCTYRSTLSVIAAYLDAFQKIADSATNAKGIKQQQQPVQSVVSRRADLFALRRQHLLIRPVKTLSSFLNQRLHFAKNQNKTKTGLHNLDAPLVD